MKKLLGTLLLATAASCYQFDNRTSGPDYPVIIPPPKKLFFFGNETWALPPCQMTIRTSTSYD